MLTKEECMVALENLKNGYRWMLPSGDNAFDKSVSILKELIKEHFDNPPLKFEELKEHMWVWDNMNKAYVQIDEDFKEENKYIILRYREDSFNSNVERIKFEENRFYRKQVEENGRD